MADNDAEIDIGINLDESSFISNYKKFLTELSAQTRLALTEAIDNVKGSAAKNWGTLPYQSFHDSESGARAATKAFVPGFATELSSLGIAKGTQAYEAALMSAAYKSSVPDAQHRYNLLQSYGQSAPAPSSAIERVLSTDYSLMAMPWSRAFIKETANKGYDAAELNKKYVRELEPMAESMGIHVKSTWNKSDLVNAIVAESNKSTMDVDFAGMRDYAVEQGIGRWLDPDKEHTADNFELINSELEKIDESSDKSEKTFKNWNDDLKSVLGTLTAIGSLTIGAAGAALAFNAKAEKGTVEAATTLERRRGFVGMSALDELAAQNASQAIGLGKNAVTNEVINLSSNREKFKLLGEGLNALYPSLTGIFDNIMSSDNPLDTYKSILKEVYGQMQGANDVTKARTLMLLESQGLGSAAQIIGAFISNPKLASELGNDPTELFSLKSNKYYGTYERAEALLPDLTQLNASIKASYNQMYTDWTETFGEPFKKWWDRTLQDKVVPWFEKMLTYLNPKSENNLIDDVSDTVFQASVASLNRRVASINSPYSIESAEGWQKAADWAIGENATNITIPSGLGPTSKWGFKTKAGEVAEGINNEDPWEFLEALQYATKEDWLGSAWASEGEEENYFKYKTRIALGWLDKTGYRSDFNTNPSQLDSEQLAKLKATTRVLQAYMATGNYDILESYAAGSYLQSPGFEAVAAFLAANKEAIRDDPQKARIVKLQLLDPFGKEIPIKVAEEIIGGDFKFESIINR